jgi:hypothetical protein
MLSDFLLGLATDEQRLAQWKENPGDFPVDLSEEERDAVRQGDTAKLRKLLYQELTRRHMDKRPHFASEYTVSISGDTPHCPVNQSGVFHPSFWSVMQPDPLWEFRGLTIVGTGIRAGLQTTPESVLCIRRATKVLFLVADPLSATLIEQLNPTAESMQGVYAKGKYRLEIYNEIIEKILSKLRDCTDVCVVFYGHPGMFVYPAHEAVRLARRGGFLARMFPGVSAEANLCADLGVDPGVAGLQSFEATNFVLNQYRFDTSAGIVLWQVGLFGFAYWDPDYKPNPAHLQVLVDYLSKHYGAEHEVVIYEAAELPLGNPRVQRCPLSALSAAKLLAISTLYVPPKGLPSANLDLAKELGIPLDR